MIYLEFCFQFSKTSRYKHLSTNTDRFSTPVLQSLVITLTGLLSLCVLTRAYIFPVATYDGSLNFYKFCLESYFVSSFESANLLFLKMFLMDHNQVLPKSVFFNIILIIWDYKTEPFHLVHIMISVRHTVCF